MNFLRRFSPSLFVLVFIGSCFMQARAQNHVPAAGTTQRQADSHKEREQPDDVELLKIKVEQLQLLVERQQRVLAAMEQRLKEVEAKPTIASAPTANPLPANETKTATNEIPSSAPTKDSLKPTPMAKSSTSATEVSQNIAKESKPVAGWNEHAFLQSPDGNFTANLIGFVQFDFRGYQSGNHPPDTFLVRRARFGIEGKLAQYFDYKVVGDFGDTRSTLLRDAFLTIHKSDKLQLRFGQFKEPFGQEEITPVNNIDFVERSMADNLVPSRSPGLMVFGLLNKGAFEYYVGAFNGKGLLATNNSNTPEGVVRLRFAPWKNESNFWLKGFAFGGAYAQGRNSNGASVIGQTESRSFTFYTPEMVNGKITRANGEFSWTLGAATIRTEYDQTNQGREGLGINNTNLPGIVAKGFVSQATYLLTGETKAENGMVTPKHDLFTREGGKNGFGAWELKARYAKLQIADGSAKSNQAQSVYFGTNWYLNRFIRYIFDFGVERFNDPVRSPKPGDKNYLVVLNRLQFVF